jgi:hypothetical protein
MLDAGGEIGRGGTARQRWVRRMGTYKETIGGPDVCLYRRIRVLKDIKVGIIICSLSGEATHAALTHSRVSQPSCRIQRNCRYQPQRPRIQVVAIVHVIPLFRYLPDRALTACSRLPYMQDELLAGS